MGKKYSVDEVRNEIYKVVRAGCSTLRRLGYDEFSELYDLVYEDLDNPNTKYEMEALDNIMRGILKAGDSLDYLEQREDMEVHTLTQVPGDRYGYYDEDGMCVEFHCGHCFEALLMDFNEYEHWVPVRIEHLDAYYYLVGHPGVVLEGLQIRERR